MLELCGARGAPEVRGAPEARDALEPLEAPEVPEVRWVYELVGFPGDTFFQIKGFAASMLESWRGRVQALFMDTLGFGARRQGIQGSEGLRL